MYIKSSILKRINWLFIILSILLAIDVVYIVIDTLVSLKYETEKEILNMHTNLASDYIEEKLQLAYLFLSYIIVCIIYLVIMGLARNRRDPN